MIYTTINIIISFTTEQFILMMSSTALNPLMQMISYQSRDLFASWQVCWRCLTVRCHYQSQYSALTSMRYENDFSQRSTVRYRCSALMGQNFLMYRRNFFQRSTVRYHFLSHVYYYVLMGPKHGFCQCSTVHCRCQNRACYYVLMGPKHGFCQCSMVHCRCQNHCQSSRQEEWRPYQCSTSFVSWLKSQS